MSEDETSGESTLRFVPDNVDNVFPVANLRALPSSVRLLADPAFGRVTALVPGVC